MCDKPRTASTYAYSVDNFTSRMRCVVAYNSGESCDLNPKSFFFLASATLSQTS